MCRFFGVSRSGYYDYVKRMDIPAWDLPLAEKIRSCQEDCGQTYGYRRVHIWLEKQGVYRNPKTVLRVMQKYGLLSVIRRKKYRNYSNYLHRYDNLLNRDFHADRSNQKWVTDISYIHTKQGKLNRYEQDRILLTQLLHEEHELHPSLGYHRLARNIFHNTGWVFSDNLAHKCCKAAGIRSKARKCRYRPPGEESIKYENLVKGHWNAKAPLQIVVSDMTIPKNNGKQWEWTLLLDTFNNEIIAHSVSPIAGDNKPYYHCLDKLNSLAGKKEEQKPQVVFHTDQGAVYSSRAFCHAHGGRMEAGTGTERQRQAPVPDPGAQLH